MTSGNWTLRSEKYETIERGNYGRSHYSTEFDDAVLSNSNTFYIRTYDRFLSLNLTNSGKAVFSNSIKMVDLHALDFNLSVLCYKAGPMQYSHGYIWFPINIDYKRDVFG
ncbi:MAG TPA: hypothetical protein PLS12_00755 [Bacteroidales bacterium]|nr:hypothetical protein [Bacteroidales bacterium]